MHEDNLALIAFFGILRHINIVPPTREMKYQPKPSEVLSTVVISSGSLNRPTFSAVSGTKSDEGSKRLFFFTNMPPTTQHAGKIYIYIKQGVETSKRQTKPKQKEHQETFDCHLIRTASKTAAASKGKTLFWPVSS